MKANYRQLIRLALEEDAALRDATTLALVPAAHRSRGVLLAKQPLVLCGMPLVRDVFLALDRRVKVRALAKEGAVLKPGTTFAEISGPTRALLSGERVALNFLQRLSGIASLTARYVAALRGTRARLLDTRKTTPGLRILEKYAVKTGGGTNHRFHLADAIMIKDNHVAMAGSVEAAIRGIGRTRLPVIVEAKNRRELLEALAAGAKRILLDNMSVAQLRESVRLAKGRAKLEASGGVTLKNIRRIAGTGVDFISVGALTHSAPAVDISLELE